MSDHGSLDAAELVAWLQLQGAHNDLVQWVDRSSLGWPQAWEACSRGDWLLGLAARAGASAEDLRRSALALASLVEDEIDEASFAAELALLRKHFAMSSLEPAYLAELERRAESAPDLALSLAFRILWLVGRSHAEPDTVAMVPGYLIELSMVGAHECALMSVVSATHRRTAEVVRAHLPAPELQRASRSNGSRAAEDTQ